MVSPKAEPKKKIQRTKSAFAEESFYYQLKAGGERGWNDQYVDPDDATQGIERFYLTFHGVNIASIEIVEKNSERQTKITIFGTPDKSPVPPAWQVSEEDWNSYFEQVTEAIQNLYQL